MAAATDIGLYKDALIVLATAAIVVPAMHRLKVGPILGFLAVGAALGPYGLGQLVEKRREGSREHHALAVQHQQLDRGSRHGSAASAWS